VRDTLLALDVRRKDSHLIVLAMDEACSNAIIHHHHCDGVSSIDVVIYRTETELRLEIEDTGKAFPIHTYKPGKLSDLVKLRRKGGLGISLIHKVMDKIEVEQFNGYYIYRFTKNLK